MDLLEDTGVFESPMVMNAANHEDLSAMGKAETLKITYSTANLMLRYWISLIDFLLLQSNSFGVYRQVFDPGGQLSRSMQHLLMKQGYGIQGSF